MVPDQCQTNGIIQGGLQSKEVKKIEMKPTQLLDIESGDRKSYVAVVGGSKQVLPKPPITVLEKGKEKITTKQGSQDPPKIMPKKRAPLQFFPFFAVPTVENRAFRGGLIIHLNEQGQRKVSWAPNEEKKKPIWVPCGPGSGVNKDTVGGLMGLKA